MKISRKVFFLLLLIVITLVSLPACSTKEATDLHMMSMDQMSMEVQSAPVTVQQAYQFAAANPDVLKEIPCYCGCGDIGHTSNYSCYVSHVDDKGNPSTGSGQAITFDNHALGCSICVDITQDVMRLMREGKSTQEARAYIDATYAKYGPSNIP